MQKLQIIERDGFRVLTTKQIAQCYETLPRVIANNFNRNKGRYVLGKHFVCLEGSDKREFINRNQIDDSSIKATKLYLWTEKGALLHAKSLNTDKAWEVYDYLVDFYFRVKEATKLKKQSLSLLMTANKQRLFEGDMRALAYNRGIVLGVLRRELEEDSTLEIYERLSVRGKGMVMKLIFGEARHAQ